MEKVKAMKKLTVMAMLLAGVGSYGAMAQEPTYTKVDDETVIYTTLDEQSGMDVASEYKVTKDAIILKSMYLADGNKPNKFKMNRDVTKSLKPSLKEKLYETVNLKDEKRNVAVEAVKDNKQRHVGRQFSDRHKYKSHYKHAGYNNKRHNK